MSVPASTLLPDELTTRRPPRSALTFSLNWMLTAAGEASRRSPSAGFDEITTAWAEAAGADATTTPATRRERRRRAGAGGGHSVARSCGAEGAVRRRPSARSGSWTTVRHRSQRSRMPTSSRAWWASLTTGDRPEATSMTEPSTCAPARTIGHREQPAGPARLPGREQQAGAEGGVPGAELAGHVDGVAGVVQHQRGEGQGQHGEPDDHQPVADPAPGRSGGHLRGSARRRRWPRGSSGSGRGRARRRAPGRAGGRR